MGKAEKLRSWEGLRVEECAFLEFGFFSGEKRVGRKGVGRYNVDKVS